MQPLLFWSGCSSHSSHRILNFTPRRAWDASLLNWGSQPLNQGPHLLTPCKLKSGAPKSLVLPHPGVESGVALSTGG